MFTLIALTLALAAQIPPPQLPTVPPALPPAAPGAYSVDPMTIMLIGGIILNAIGTIVNGVITVITNIRMTAVGAQQTQTADRLVTIVKDTEAIKGHVNSEKTAAAGREAALQQEIRLLREMLADKTIAASLLAQAAASSSSSGGVRSGRATDPPAGARAPLPVEVVNAPLMVEVEQASGGGDGGA